MGIENGASLHGVCAVFYLYNAMTFFENDLLNRKLMKKSPEVRLLCFAFLFTHCSVHR